MAKDLKKVAVDCLAFNKHFDKVFVTSDGVPFQYKNDAVNYAAKLTEKEVEVFEREGSQDAATTAAEKTYDLNAKDTIKLITAAESIEAVEDLLKDDDRATVKTAGEKQIAILKQKALDDQAAAADEANAQRNAEIPKDPEGTEALGNGVDPEAANDTEGIA